MRLNQKNALAVAMLSGALLASFEQARATDLTGAWATDAGECKNVFVRKGKGDNICPDVRASWRGIYRRA
jgi:hypothetical protein